VNAMSFSQRLFHLMLFAYPREFRQEYGSHMTQLFQDCRREQHHQGLRGAWSLWLLTLGDLLTSAPREHLERFRKESSAMISWQRNVVALVACLAISVIALLLLAYGRSHEVPAILNFGRSLDALVTAGILGNLIIFGLRFTKIAPLRVALWTMLVVNAVLLIVTCLLGSRVDPTFRLGSILVAYLVSFVFWFGLHWAWSKASPPLAVVGE
jgi:phosphatidylglycerophosphate synthase